LHDHLVEARHPVGRGLGRRSNEPQFAFDCQSDAVALTAEVYPRPMNMGFIGASAHIEHVARRRETPAFRSNDHD